jgi:DNA repair exonuclease SbcCD ATPase subunit
MLKAGLLLLLAGANAYQAATPVDKVVSLLTKLSAQVQAEGVAEAASYDKYSCFCKAQADDKVHVIAKSDKKIEELDASIKELEGEITELDETVAKSKEKVTTEEGTQKDNLEAREKSQKIYEEKKKSLVEAVSAVERALETMRNSRDDVAAQNSLLQKLAKKLTGNDPAIISLLQSSKPGEAKAYQYASKDVIATLTSLTATFKKELADLQKEEMEAVGDYEMAAGARANAISAVQKEINEKETLSATKGEEKSDKDGQKTEETTARNADQKFLDDLTLKCEEKAEAWDKRSTTRAGELTALGQAVELLKGSRAQYGANAKLVGLISKDNQKVVGKHLPPALLQLRSVQNGEEKLQKLTGQLTQKAASLKSASLAMLALQIQIVGPDHFVKVRGIIKDLISKLEADAAGEATAKTVCDKNMKAAVEKRDKQAAAAETAGAEIDSTAASINTLKDEIADLSATIAGLNKDMLEATELRAGEKASNAKTLADAEAGKEAIDQAITILGKFYGSFIQQDPKSRDGKTVGDLAPETFSSDEEYKGKTEASKGIIGMLEVISSDFERTLKTVATGEEDAGKDYDELQADTDKEVKAKAKLKADKETLVKTKEGELTGFKDDKHDADTMHEESLEELEKLTASCVETGESYAERVAHRKQEIEALQDAMKILEDWQ